MVIIYIDKESEARGGQVTCDGGGSQAHPQPHRILGSLNNVHFLGLKKNIVLLTVLQCLNSYFLLMSIYK